VRFSSDDSIEVAGPPGITRYIIGGEDGALSVPAEAVFRGPGSVTVIGLRSRAGARDIDYATASGQGEVTDAGWFRGTDFRWGPRERWEGPLSAAAARGALDEETVSIIDALARSSGEPWSRSVTRRRTNPPLGAGPSRVAEIAAAHLQESFGMKAVTAVAAGASGTREEWMCAAASERRIVLFDRDGGLRAEIEAPGTVSSLWIGQLPDGGSPVLVAGTREGHTIAFDPGGAELWRHRLEAPFLYSVCSYTVGTAELQSIGPCVVVGTYSGFYALGGAGAWTWGRHAYGGFANNFIAADLFGEGGLRLVGASFMGCATVFDTGGEVDIPVPCWSGRNGRCHTLAVRDLDGDGIGELFLAHDCGLARVCFTAGLDGRSATRPSLDGDRTWRHWTDRKSVV
jgi:hypothetical protein